MNALLLFAAFWVTSEVSLPKAFAAGPITCTGWVLKKATWAEEPGILKPVSAFRVPGAFAVDGDPSVAQLSLLSETFFQEAGLALPRTDRVEMHTYPYYFPSSRDPRRDRLSRGSGRDHVVVGPFAVKGSGTNPHYSRANAQDFDVADFRRNGLAPIVDSNADHGGGFTEYVVAKNLEAMGIPTVPHRGLVLLPRSFHPFVKKYSVSERPVQIIRDLSVPRESMTNQIPTVKDRLRTSAALTFWNVNHGALNPENLTIRAEIIDLGHVGSSYPVLNGAYRCTLCKGIAGSDLDRTLLGPLDYFFPWGPREVTRPAPGEVHDLSFRTLGRNSMGFHLQRDEWEGYTEQLLSFLRAGSSAPAFDNEVESAFKAVHWQGIRFQDQALWEARGFGNMARLQDALLGTDLRAYRKKGDSDQVYEPVRFSLSLRFMMQLAATRSFVEEANYSAMTHRVREWLDTDSQVHFDSLLHYFERAFEANRLEKSNFERLFQEYPTAGEVQFRTQIELSKVWPIVSDETLVGRLKGLLTRLSTPVVIDPVHFNQVLRTFEPKK